VGIGAAIPESDGPPVVVVVGDGEVPAALRVALLAVPCRATLTRCEDAAEVLGWLRPDLLVLLGDAATRRAPVGELPGLAWTPTLAVTDHPLDALRAGVRDAADLGASSELLAAKIEAALAARSQLVGLLRHNRELDLLAGVDVLTDLPNRRRLDEQLRVLEAGAARRGDPLGLVIVDVDRFKTVNDVDGHDAGDEVLRVVARALRSEVRTEDVVARGPDAAVGRWGGDEFVLGFAGAGRAHLEHVGARLRRAVSRGTTELGLGIGAVTVSIGGAVARGEPWPELLRRADAALLQAKALGRDSLVLLPS
jgi:diguanylate cyclase (GGDEF)-like protein